MEIVEYRDIADTAQTQAYLAACEWSAGRYLAKLVRTNTLDEELGEGARIFFLMDGSSVVSFATLSKQDAIRDEALSPWIGFVFTDRRYRGHRYSRRLIDHALNIAREAGYPAVYLTTGETGLYEKYGFVYRENRIDIWGEDSRIYVYSL